MSAFYALRIDGKIKLVIPWRENDLEEPPTLNDFAQAMSKIWATTGTDFSFGPPTAIDRVAVVDIEEDVRDVQGEVRVR